jgi:hypothetical protein
MLIVEFDTDHTDIAMGPCTVVHAASRNESSTFSAYVKSTKKERKKDTSINELCI